MSRRATRQILVAGKISILFEAPVFELDGTLIDSAPDGCASVNRGPTADGRRALTLTEVKDMVG